MIEKLSDEELKELIIEILDSERVFNLLKDIPIDVKYRMVRE